MRETVNKSIRICVYRPIIPTTRCVADNNDGCALGSDYATLSIVGWYLPIFLLSLCNSLIFLDRSSYIRAYEAIDFTLRQIQN